MKTTMYFLNTFLLFQHGIWHAQYLSLSPLKLEILIFDTLEVIINIWQTFEVFLWGRKLKKCKMRKNSQTTSNLPNVGFSNSSQRNPSSVVNYGLIFPFYHLWKQYVQQSGVASFVLTRGWYIKNEIGIKIDF